MPGNYSIIVLARRRENWERSYRKEGRGAVNWKVVNGRGGEGGKKFIVRGWVLNNTPNLSRKVKHIGT